MPLVGTAARRRPSPVPDDGPQVSAMRDTPARPIQELAGQDLSTKQRYMHLSPAAIEGAIRLLEMEGPPKGGRHVLSQSDREDIILETADA
jgi:hypothetical protein